MRVKVGVLAAVAFLVVAGPQTVQSQQLSAQETHDRIVAVMARNVSRAIPGGDTFVTWSPRPVLYTTVRRTASTVASSLVRADGMVGTAEAVWRGGVQRQLEIRWTQGDSILLDLNLQFHSATFSVSGSRDTTLPVPSLAWAVADYGMEDQLLPLLAALPSTDSPERVAVYRPYAEKWDTLTLVSSSADGARLVTVTEPDGEHFFWTVTRDGALVRITRDRHADVERRPLETTTRFADYLNALKLWKH